MCVFITMLTWIEYEVYKEHSMILSKIILDYLIQDSCIYRIPSQRKRPISGSRGICRIWQKPIGDQHRSPYSSCFHDSTLQAPAQRTWASADGLDLEFEGVLAAGGYVSLHSFAQSC